MPDQLSPEGAEAVHKARNAAQAVELAREAQIAEAISKSAEETKKALLEGLKEVFGNGDQDKDPKEMRILVQRIPILCTNIDNMHALLQEMRSNQTWVVRLIVGGVIGALLTLVLK